jgi:hypothetical protein
LLGVALPILHVRNAGKPPAVRHFPRLSHEHSLKSLERETVHRIPPCLEIPIWNSCPGILLVSLWRESLDREPLDTFLAPGCA